RERNPVRQSCRRSRQSRSDHRARRYANLRGALCRCGSLREHAAFAGADSRRPDPHDTPVYPAVLFGAIRAGLVPLLINTLTPPDLLQFLLADSSARVAVAEASFADRFNSAACGDTELATLAVIGEPPTGTAVKAISLDRLAKTAAPALPACDTHRD